MSEINETERRAGLLEAYDFKIQSRAEFEVEASAKIVFRAREFTGAYVLWDLCDDEDGFLICGDSADALRAEWHEHYSEL